MDSGLSSLNDTWIINSSNENEASSSLSTAIQTLSSHSVNFTRYVKNKKKYEPLDTKEKFELIEAKQAPVITCIKTSLPDWKTAEKKLFSSLSWDALQIGGEPLDAEFIIADLIQKSSAVDTMNWLNQMYLGYSSNSLLLCTILHALSHIDYEMIYPGGPMIVVASLSNDDKRVVSFAIKAFSNWNSKESLRYATSFSPKDSWAKREWNKVVNYIQENGDEIIGIFDEENLSGTMDSGSA